MAVLTGKHCTYCWEYKDLEYFSKDRTRTDGHQASCKSCQKYSREQRAVRANAELLRSWRPVASSVMEE